MRLDCRAPAGRGFDRDQAAAPGIVCTGSMKHKILRRMLAPALIVGGALLMWLSPETLSGVVLMGAGIALEALGLAFGRG